MFRAHRAHHQERQIVSIQPLAAVTLCWWPCHVQVGSDAQSTKYKISQSSVCHFQIGMGAPLVTNSTRMKKIICFIPNSSRFCVSFDFTGTLNANYDFIDILRQWDCLDHVL